MFALSIRQPWAWLIVNGYKDIENRTWNSNFRGWLAIHASSSMTKYEYQSAKEFACSAGVDLCYFPTIENLDRGGIVGAAYMTNCVISYNSAWWQGPYGFVLKDACSIPKISLPGRLGIFHIPLHIASQVAIHIRKIES